MIGRTMAILFIFLGTSAGWIFLAETVDHRTDNSERSLKGDVSALWGELQRQQAPEVYASREEEAPQERPALEGSTIDVRLALDQRRKGLLWYPTYRVLFKGVYEVANRGETEEAFLFEFPLPSNNAVYDNIRVTLDDEKVEVLDLRNGAIRETLRLAPGESRMISISYGSRGMEEWWYVFGEDVRQVKNFSLTMRTDFNNIDFPERSISPTEKRPDGGGMELQWHYENLLSGIQIGMEMPRKLNPGPWMSRLIWNAPVSLFLFLFVLLVVTSIRGRQIHPINYFFVSAAFFSFHLLMAYLIDHVEIHLAFLLAATVSVALVISYMRLVAGMRFALLETGISQLVYLILFSYAFFFEGYTGLTVTVLAILTLFVVMQYTGRFDWERLFPDRKEIRIMKETPAS